nr:DUF4010 domain-containing protein [Sideroxydans sp. CL21]
MVYPLCRVGGLAVGIGWLWSKRRDANDLKLISESEPKNPLEISAALLFALLFVVMLIATHFAIVYLGERGVYTLATIMGVTDVDPFIMGLTQATPTLTPLHVASSSILIAASSNNVVKGIYAFVLSSRQTGTMSLAFLSGLAVLGLMPLLI